MNIVSTPGESLCSGDSNDIEQPYISVHNCTFDGSNDFKNASNLLQIIKNEVDYDEKNMPLCIHIEWDGGSKHNTKHLHNQAFFFSIFPIFLRGDMDYLMAYHECPGLSYSLTCERAMSLLTLDTANLALSVNQNVPKWLFSNVLGKASSMKTVQVTVYQYDEDVPISIARLKQILDQVKNTKESQDNILNDDGNKGM